MICSIGELANKLVAANGKPYKVVDWTMFEAAIRYKTWGKTSSSCAVFHGRVTRVSGALGSDRCMPAEIDLPNSARKLQSGMFLKVRLSLETHASVPAVPSSALVDEKGKLSVFVVEAGKAIKKPVQVGFRNPDWAEVKQGLSGSEEVVSSGKDQLVDGATVEVSR